MLDPPNEHGTLKKSLYTLCLTNNSLFGIITPFGGVILLVAWSCFLLSIIKKQN